MGTGRAGIFPQPMREGGPALLCRLSPADTSIKFPRLNGNFVEPKATTSAAAAALQPDRRQTPRVTPTAPIPARLDEAAAEILNVGEGGLMLQTETPVLPDTLHQLTVTDRRFSGAL